MRPHTSGVALLPLRLAYPHGMWGGHRYFIRAYIPSSLQVLGHRLAWRWVSDNAGRSLEQSNLALPASDQSWKDTSTGLVPLGKLLLSDSVWVLTRIQTFDQGGGTGIAASNVEGPRDEGTVLVRI